MEPFVPPFETPFSEIVPLSPSFETLSPTLGMTESNSMAFATQMDVPELELLSQGVESPLGEGFDPLTGISLSRAENLTIPEDIRPENTDIPRLIPDLEPVTAGTDEPLDVVLFGGQLRQQRELTPPVIVAQLLNQTDGVTSNPLIEGTLTDDSPIIKFTAGFDGTPERQYYNLRGLLEPNGKFSLDAARLRQVNQNRSLTEGQHTLHLLALDQWNNLSKVDLTFTVDTAGPRLIVGLVSDTGSSLRDRITAEAAISGRIVDSSAIVSFKAGFDTTPLSNFVDVTCSDLQT